MLLVSPHNRLVHILNDHPVRRDAAEASLEGLAESVALVI
jgi:hypothetical protein